MINRKEWEIVRFGDVVRQVKNKVDSETSGLERFVAGEHMTTDDLRIRSWGTIGNGYLGPAFNTHFKPGQVLYGSRRTYLRKVALADFEGICANTTFVLESKDPKVLLPELLPFIMQTQSFNDHSVKQSKGSVNPYVNFSDLAWFEFALPPLEEQRRIAELLMEVDRVTAAIEDVISSHSLIIEAFIQEEFQNFNAKCEHKTAKEIMERITVGIVVKPADLYVEAGHGVLALRSLNVFPGRFVLNETVEINHNGHKAHDKSALKTGDIVIVRTGRPGDAAVIPPELDGTNCIDLIVAKPGSDIIAQYVVTFLNSQFGRRLFASGMTGTAQQHFNVGEFSKMKLPLPKIEEQKRFVERLKQISSPSEMLKERLININHIRIGVLKSIFERGE